MLTNDLLSLLQNSKPNNIWDGDAQFPKNWVYIAEDFLS